MKKKERIWLAAAAALIVLGGIIFGGAMTVLKWDFTKLSAVRYETNRYEMGENDGAFENISITAGTADVLLLPAEGDLCTVECYEREKVRHTVTVKDGTLTVEVTDTRKWYEHIGICFGTPRVTVYLPKEMYGMLAVKVATGGVRIEKGLGFKSIDVAASTGDVTCHASADEGIKIKTSTGRIHTEGLTAASLDLSVTAGGVTVKDIACAGGVTVKVSTGKARLTGVTCNSFTSNGNTGELSLTDVIAVGALSVTRSTGDVRLEGCDAAELYIETDTGDVTGSLLSEKVFIVHTDTGKKEVPDTIHGGRCKITTDTGDIKIAVEG